jgi:predicted RNase H-like HicB family nuclease
MNHAEYSVLSSGRYYGEIPGLQGVWADGPTPEETERELQEVLEGWIILRLDRHLSIPEVDGISLRTAPAA